MIELQAIVIARMEDSEVEELHYHLCNLTRCKKTGILEWSAREGMSFHDKEQAEQVANEMGIKIICDETSDFYNYGLCWTMPFDVSHL